MFFYLRSVAAVDILEKDVEQLLRAENDQLTEEVKKLKMNQSTIIRRLEAIEQQRSSKHDYCQDNCYDGYNEDEYR